jgi:hypothetical protein
MVHNPLEEIETAVKGAHDEMGKYTQPTLRKYPLTFLFLLVCSASAIFHGFEMWIDTVPMFTNHPVILIGLGTVALFLTGTLYKTLNKMR